MVRITPKSFLKSMASQGKPDEPQCHMSNFVPEVDVCGVQHHCLEAVQAEGMYTCTHMTTLLTEQSDWGQRDEALAQPYKLPRARKALCLLITSKAGSLLWSHTCPRPRERTQKSHMEQGMVTHACSSNTLQAEA